MSIRYCGWNVRWAVPVLGMLAIGTAGTAGAQGQAQPAAPASAASAPQVSAKMGPLVALIVQPLVAQAGKVLAERAKEPLSDGIGSLFNRLMGGRPQKTDYVPFTATAAASGAATGAVVPSLIYTVDRLEPGSFRTLDQLAVGGVNAPSLKTGDVFAVRFATNVPGQVRIDNVDAQGVRSPLGTYSVLPGQDNRVPRTKGIQLEGSTGLETFQVYFYPCLPAEAATLRGYDTYKATLPACGNTGAVGNQLLLASKGQIRTRGARNLDLEDPSMVVAAVTDFQPRDVIEQRFQLQHDPR